MLQLRMIREYTRPGETKPEKAEKSVKPKIYFSNLGEFVEKAESEVLKIPESERYNIYLTLNHVNQAIDKRVDNWVKQDLIMWDLDDVSESDKEKVETYQAVLASVIKVPMHSLVAITTGGGFHFIMQLKKPITKQDFFQNHSIHYQIHCGNVNDELVKQGLSGFVDPQVFAPNRMCRVHGTISKKKGRPDTPVTIKAPIAPLEPVDWDIIKSTGLPELDPKKDMMSKDELSYIKVDTDTVESGCGFLKYTKENQPRVNEPQWYAMLTIIGRLQDGEKKAHEYSKLHPKYSEPATTRKLKQALDTSGARSCRNIESLWDGCSKCPHYKKLRSPIALKGKDFIATAKTGFHVLNARLQLIPQYDDLQKYYHKEVPYINSNKTHYRFEKTQWSEYPEVYIDNFAESNFFPKAGNVMCSEFRGKVRRTNLRKPDWFASTTHRKMNFSNGVLDIDKMVLAPHSEKYGFKNTLPFEYDKEADAPKFRQMLKNVTLGDVALQKVLLEFLGYSISGDRCVADKMLVLTGEGQNGKSRFLNVYKALGGSGVQGLSFKDMGKSSNMHLLDGAHFNIMEEVPAFSNKESWEMIKNLVAGGDVTADPKYKDPYLFENKCKLIMTCNNLPKGMSQNHGYFRRMMIVPFNATFSAQAGNLERDIDQQVIKNEMPGVANMALKAYKALVDNDYHFTKSDKIDEALDEYQEELDSVRRWADEHIRILEPDESVGKDLLAMPDWMQKTSKGEVCANRTMMYKSYAQWCQEGGEKPVANGLFGKRLRKRLLSQDSRIDFERKEYIDKKQVRVVFGIGFYDSTSY